MADKYTKGLIVPDETDIPEKRDKFYQERLKLQNSPVHTTGQLNSDLVSDLPAQKIDKLQMKDITSPSDVAEKVAAHRAERDMLRERLPSSENTINYNDFKKKPNPSKVPGSTLDYKQLRQEFMEKAKSAIKKPKGVAAMAATALLPMLVSDAAQASTPYQAATRALEEGDPVSAFIPGDAGPSTGSFDQRLEAGQLTPEEKQQLLIQQARIRALRGM